MEQGRALGALPCLRYLRVWVFRFMSWWVVFEFMSLPVFSLLVFEFMSWWVVFEFMSLSVFSLLVFEFMSLWVVFELVGLSFFCPLFSRFFNTKSAIFIHQPLTLPQKIDSREGLFWCKKELACECSKMNIYFKKPPFAPHLGLFAAKCTAICCKTQCNMPLNAVRFGAKCSAFWC